MAGLEAHYSARDIEARILAALHAAGLNPGQRLSPEELGALFRSEAAKWAKVIADAKIQAE